MKQKTVEQVLLDMVGVCEEGDFTYAVMGGLAVRVHGIPRPTYDVDFQLTVHEEQLSRFVALVEQRDYTISEQYVAGWRDRVGGMPLIKLKTYMAGGHSIDVDIFISETSFQFSTMKRRVRLELEGQSMWFVSAEDLILLKLLANRPRDIGDITDILFMQGELDEAYMQKWSRPLGVESQLAKVLEESRQSP
jgi:hypothetical protein